MSFNPGVDLTPPDPFPVEGSFLLPLCVTDAQLELIMQCVEEGGLLLGLGRQNDHLVPFWEAFSHISDPENAACFPTVNDGGNDIDGGGDGSGGDIDGGGDGSGGAPGGVRLLNCVELLDCDGDGIAETINIREDCEDACMVTINVYEGCCGDGGKVPSTGTGTAAGLGGSVDGGLSVGEGVGGATGISKCDVASYILPYALTQGKEFFEEMGNFVDNGGNIVDFFEEAADFIDPLDATPVIASSIKSVIEQSGNALEQTIDFFEDEDFLLVYQEAWWRRTSELGLFEGRVETITGDDLKYGIRYLPLTWGQALDGVIVVPRIMLDLFFSIINEQKLQRRLILAENQANDTLCEYLAGQIGETYTPGVTPGAQPTIPQGTTRTYQGSTAAWDIEIAILGTPLTIADGSSTLPIAVRSGRTLGAAGMSVSGFTGGGGRWRELRLIARGAGGPLLTSRGEVAVGQDFWVGATFDTTQITQADFDGILAEVEGVIGAFPISEVPGVTLVPEAYGPFPEIYYGGAFGPQSNQGQGAVFDWVFLVTRAAST